MPQLLDLMTIELARAAGKTEMYRVLTYVKVTAGTRNPAARTSGTQPTTQNFPCKGLITAFSNIELLGETIQVGDRRILIYSNTLVLPTGIVPGAEDQVIADDLKTYTVLNVERDPSGAVYIVHGRG